MGRELADPVVDELGDVARGVDLLKRRLIGLLHVVARFRVGVVTSTHLPVARATYIEPKNHSG